MPGLTLSGEVQVLSSQFEAPGQPRNPGYTVVNAAAAYRLPIKRWGFLSNITLHVRATNLFNEDYSEVAGFPALGTLRGRRHPRHIRLSSLGQTLTSDTFEPASGTRARKCREVKVP